MNKQSSLPLRSSSPHREAAGRPVVSVPHHGCSGGVYGSIRAAEKALKLSWRVRGHFYGFLLFVFCMDFCKIVLLIQIFSQDVSRDGSLSLYLVNSPWEKHASLGQLSVLRPANPFILLLPSSLAWRGELAKLASHTHGESFHGIQLAPYCLWRLLF